MKTTFCLILVADAVYWIPIFSCKDQVQLPEKRQKWELLKLLNVRF